jgi:hypothetical protein
MTPHQPSLPGLAFIPVVTRQFLPGYSHSRLSALVPLRVREFLQKIPSGGSSFSRQFFLHLYTRIPAHAQGLSGR